MIVSLILFVISFASFLAAYFSCKAFEEELFKIFLILGLVLLMSSWIAFEISFAQEQFQHVNPGRYIL